VGRPVHGSTRLEIAWTVIRSSSRSSSSRGGEVFFSLSRPPANAVEYYVVGKQWMWKFQHPEGKREINELHVRWDRGQADHDLRGRDPQLFVPAFRIKADVLPGRYTTTWFEATKTGSYHSSARSTAAPSTR